MQRCRNIWLLHTQAHTHTRMKLYIRLARPALVRGRSMAFKKCTSGVAWSKGTGTVYAHGIKNVTKSCNQGAARAFEKRRQQPSDFWRQISKKKAFVPLAIAPLEDWKARWGLYLWLCAIYLFVSIGLRDNRRLASTVYRRSC